MAAKMNRLAREFKKAEAGDIHALAGLARTALAAFDLADAPERGAKARRDALVCAWRKVETACRQATELHTPRRTS